MELALFLSLLFLNTVLFSLLFNINKIKAKTILISIFPILFSINFSLKYLIPNFLEKFRLKLACKSIHEDTIEFLNTLSTCLLAGLNLKQALERTLEEEKLNSLIKYPILRITKKISFGESLFDSMLCVYQETKEEPSLKYLSLSFYLLAKAHGIGGNLTNTIKQLKDKINFKIIHMRKMKISTAQMRLQAWIISLAPCILSLILWCISPNYILIFFDNSIGFILLLVMITLNVFGSYLLIKIANKLVIE
jgi:tight adherence protein B